MHVQLLRSFWGMESIARIEDRVRMIREAGYSGVEAPIPDMEPREWRALLDANGLSYVAMMFPVTPDEFRRQLEAVHAYGPTLVTSQSGRDCFSFSEGCEFFLAALQAERDVGVPVAHETHRGRIFFTPWRTAQYLEEFPDLRICADFSHWCAVCESTLQGHEHALELACERAIHVHARVGYEEGPQVPDPRAPEYASHLARHEAWWDAIVSARAGSGAQSLTITPEFGPPPYMHALPYTQQPVADLWDLCLWTAGRLRQRYASRPPR